MELYVRNRMKVSFRNPKSFSTRVEEVKLRDARRYKLGPAAGSATGIESNRIWRQLSPRKDLEVTLKQILRLSRRKVRLVVGGPLPTESLNRRTIDIGCVFVHRSSVWQHRDEAAICGSRGRFCDKPMRRAHPLLELERG